MKQFLTLAFMLTVGLSTAADGAIVTAVYADSAAPTANSLVVMFDDANLAAGFSSISVNGAAIATAGSIANGITTPDTMTGPSVLISTFIGAGAGDILVVSGGTVTTATGGFSSLTGALNVQSIPEPSTMAGIMLLSLAGLGRRRRQKQVA